MFVLESVIFHSGIGRPQLVTTFSTYTYAGNAVTVPVARWLGERLMHPYARKYVLGAKDRKLGSEFDPDYEAVKGARSRLRWMPQCVYHTTRCCVYNAASIQPPTRCTSCSLLFDDALDALTVDRSSFNAAEVQALYGQHDVDGSDDEEGRAMEAALGRV